MEQVLDQAGPLEVYAPGEPLPPAPRRRLPFQQERAAALAAEGALKEASIAAVVGVDVRTYRSWLSRPAFREELDALREEFARSVSVRGAARREVRLACLADRHDALLQVQQERARAVDPGSPFYVPGAESVPGASTGLLVRELRALGSGRGAVQVEEWRMDRGLLQELRAVEEAASVETGQKVERVQLLPAGKAYVGVPVDEV